MHTVKIIDGKPWVVEVLGIEPVKMYEPKKETRPSRLDRRIILNIVRCEYCGYSGATNVGEKKHTCAATEYFDKAEKMLKEPQRENYSPCWLGEGFYKSALHEYERKLKESAYPTLPEHFAHWKALEGKEFDDKDFDIYMGCYKAEQYKRCLCDNTECTRMACKMYAFPVPIPQPNEDEVWGEVKAVLWQSLGITSHQSEAITKYLKSHYSLSKK